MSTTRAVIVVAAMALASAGVVALASRTPARVRADDPGRAATDPSLGASFTDAQVRRHAAYRGPGYLALGLSLAVHIALLVVLARGPFAALVGGVERLRGGMVVHAVVLGAAVAVMIALALLPIGFVRGYVVARDWGLSTQDLGGWAGDQLRGVAIAAVIAAIAAAAFFTVVRWRPSTWWLWGWAAFTVLTAVLVYLWPVVIAPLFNRFTPLADDSLSARIKHMAAEAGVDVERVLVADASRRTTAENAYVAGVGPTKRVVVYDTLLESGGEDETLFVAAHELGHEAEGHVWKGIVLSSIGLFVGFAALWWLASRTDLFAWGPSAGVSDLRALPLLLVFALVAGVVALPAQNAVSRAHEATADRIALGLTGDPDTAVRVYRRLAFSNLADLDPPTPAVWLLYTHPPVTERIEDALQGADSA